MPDASSCPATRSRGVRRLVREQRRLDRGRALSESGLARHRATERRVPRLDAIGERTFEITERRPQSTSASTSRSRASAASAAGSPSASRSARSPRRRSRPSGDRRSRRRDPRRRRQRRRRGRRRRPRVVRRRDDHDRPARRRPRDLASTRRAATCATSTASSRCRPARARRWRSCACRSARSSSTTRSARRRARCPASRPASTRCGARTDACRGRASSSRRCALARAGVAMPPAHVACLRMLAPVMTMREGAAMYAPGGTLLEAGDVLQQPGLVRALELVRDEGAAGRLHRHDRAHQLERSLPSAAARSPPGDLAGYAPLWSEPVAVPFAGRRVLTRAGLSRRPRDASRASTRRPAPTALLAALDERRAGRRPHDEHHGGRRRRQRVRVDDEPRPRLRRLAAGARPAPEQHARRARPRARAASSRRRGWRA